GHYGAVVDGRSLREVDAERGIAHRGPGRDDDELTFLQTAGHAVELGEVRGEARYFPAMLVEIVDAAEGVLDDDIERLQAACDALFTDLEQLGLRRADYFQSCLALIGCARDCR